MDCHQILSGACNAGDQCFAVGSVEGVPFTVRNISPRKKLLSTKNQSFHNLIAFIIANSTLVQAKLSLSVRRSSKLNELSEHPASEK
jgi:hypothetical protein